MNILKTFTFIVGTITIALPWLLFPFLDTFIPGITQTGIAHVLLFIIFVTFPISVIGFVHLIDLVEQVQENKEGYNNGF